MELLRSPAVRWVILGALLLVLIWVALKVWRWMAGAGERELSRQLQEALADGNAALAGDIQVRRGNLVEASRIFQRAKEYERAGTVFAMLGKDKEAAEEFEKGSIWAKAGPLFKKIGEPARAAACLERSTERVDRVAAAECWLAANESLKAARLFQDTEEFERAADAFTKVDDLASLEVALTMLENAALAEKENEKRKRRLWARAGEVGLKLGAHERAARAFDEAGAVAKAAEIYENALKKLDVAAALYAEAGDTDAAERLTKASGGSETVLQTRAARARARGEVELADKLLGDSGSKNATSATVVKLGDSEKDTMLAASDKKPDVAAQKRGLDLGDRFELAGELGRGGMGIVYRARDQRLGRFVALKFLPEDVEAGSTLARLFRREGRAAAALAHPGIVTVYDAGDINGREFIAMELAEGVTLDRVLEEQGPLPPAEALEIMEKVLEAIEYAHGKNVIHRDLKPANLMRTKVGIKVMDFGLAKVIGSQSSGQTVVGGTPNYMPPEQATGHADHRSDVFSLGVTFYELLTGVLPGRPGEPASVANQYPSPRERMPAVPARLSELVMFCLERDRDSRAQDVVSVLREVREIRAELAAPKAAAKREAEVPKAAAKREPEAQIPVVRREETPKQASPAPVTRAQPTPQKRPLPPRISREDEEEGVSVQRIDHVPQKRPVPDRKR